MKASNNNSISNFTDLKSAQIVRSIIFLLCGVSVCISGLSAQDVLLSDTFSSENLEYVENTAVPIKADNDTRVIRTAAVFNGGYEFKNIDQFVAAHLVFPSEAIGTGRYGIVKVRFEILKDGEIGELVILESPGKAFDDAVAELLAQMPAWTPARENGEPKTSVYQLKLNFRLQ